MESVLRLAGEDDSSNWAAMQGIAAEKETTMPSIGRNTKSVQMQQLTPQEIQARWGALLPKVVKWMIFFAAATLAVFIYNHVATPSQKVTDILNTAFQIGCIFVVCFAFLTAAAVFFKSDMWLKKK